MNGVVKDDAFEGLGSPKRRRIRGQAAQSVIVAFLIFAMNIRMIESFIKFAVVGPDGTISRPKVRRRKTAPLSDWDPPHPEDEGWSRGTSPPEPSNH